MPYEREYRHFWVALIILSCLAAVLIYWSTARYGVGVSPDSIGYIHVAKKIQAEGLAFLAKKTAIVQPPLYPIVLASIGHATGLPPWTAARLLNMALGAGIVALLMLSARRMTNDETAILFVGLLSCFSMPILFVASYAWTEPMFLLLICATLLTLSPRRVTIVQAFMAGLLVAAACLTRYAGITLIAAAGIYLALGRCDDRDRWFGRLVAFAGPPCGLLGMYLARNFLLAGTLTGPRVPSDRGIVENTLEGIREFFGLLLPGDAKFVAALLVFLAALLAVAWPRARKVVIQAVRSARPPFALAALFTVIYVAFVVWTSSRIAYDRINMRLLSPVYPTLLLTLAPWVVLTRWDRKLRPIVVTCVILLVAFSIPRSVKLVARRARQGAGGYNTTAWHESPLFRHLKRSNQWRAETVFTNEPWAIALLTGNMPNRAPMHKARNSPLAFALDRETLLREHPKFDGSLLIWYDNSVNDYMCPPEQMANICRLTELRRFDDGAFYRVEIPRETTSPTPNVAEHPNPQTASTPHASRSPMR
jgi:hypothetical protein